MEGGEGRGNKTEDYPLVQDRNLPSIEDLIVA